MILEVIQNAYYAAIATAKLVRKGTRPNWINIRTEVSKMLPRGLSKSSVLVSIVSSGSKVDFQKIHECYDKFIWDTNVLYASIEKLNQEVEAAQNNYAQKKAELVRRLVRPSVLKVPGAIIAREDDLLSADTIDLSETTAYLDFSAGVALPRVSRNVEWYAGSAFTLISSGKDIAGSLDSITDTYANTFWKSNGDSEIILRFEDVSKVSALELDPVGIFDVEIATSTDGVGFTTVLETKLIKNIRLEFGSVSCLALRVRMKGELTGLRTLRVGHYMQEIGDYLTTQPITIPSGVFGTPAINSISLEPKGYIQLSGSTEWIPSDWNAQEQLSYFEGITQGVRSVVSGGYCDLSGATAITFGPYTKVIGGYDAVDVTTGTVLGSVPVHTQLPAYPNFSPTSRFTTDYFCGVATVGGVDGFRINPHKLATGCYADIEFTLSGSSNLTLSVPSGIVGSVKLYIDGRLVSSMDSSTTKDSVAFCSSPCQVKISVVNSGCNIYQYILLKGIEGDIMAKLQEYSPCNYYSLTNCNVPDFSYSYKLLNGVGHLYVPLAAYSQKIRAYYRLHSKATPITSFRCRFDVESSLDKYTVVVK